MNKPNRLPVIIASLAVTLGISSKTTFVENNVNSVLIVLEGKIDQQEAPLDSLVSRTLSLFIPVSRNCNEYLCFKSKGCKTISNSKVECVSYVANYSKLDHEVSIQNARLLSVTNDINNASNLKFGGNTKTSTISIPAESTLALYIDFPSFPRTEKYKKIQIIGKYETGSINIQCILKNNNCKRIS